MSQPRTRLFPWVPYIHEEKTLIISVQHQYSTIIALTSLFLLVCWSRRLCQFWSNHEAQCTNPQGEIEALFTVSPITPRKKTALLNRRAFRIVGMLIIDLALYCHDFEWLVWLPDQNNLSHTIYEHTPFNVFVAVSHNALIVKELSKKTLEWKV